MELPNNGHSKEGRFTLNLVGISLFCTQDGRLSIIHEIYPGSIQDEVYFNWILKAFKAHKINLLIATDVAARGLDINNFSHVFNYDISKFPENYIHRIGRTSRLNKRGGLIDKEIKERTIYSQENTQYHNPFY